MSERIRQMSHVSLLLDDGLLCWIDEMVKTGLWGEDRAEVIRSLLQFGCQDAAGRTLVNHDRVVANIRALGDA